MSEPAGYRIDKTFTMPVASTPPTQPAMPPSNPRRDLADLVRHVVVTEVRPGDVLVFETDQALSDEELEWFREGVREGVAEDVRVIVVERSRLGGVLRHAPGRLVTACGRCGHIFAPDPETQPCPRCAVVEGGRP